jgi:type II restriction enzyme
MNKDFDKFMSQLQETNQTLNFFCDFDKIADNIDNIKLSLCMLNSLIGATDLRKSVEMIWNRDSSAFRIMDILIAVRGKKVILNSAGKCIILDRLFTSVDGIMEYLEGTGLANIFREKRINNLVDYVSGIEVGLDSNARKNRSGNVMEEMIADILKKHDITFRQKVCSTEWPDIQNILGNDEKEFDFVITTDAKTYVVEVNFYNSGGSKLNEIARSYSDIGPKINSVPGFEFVWITDGVGWKSARNKLQEAYNIIPSIYNLVSIEDFIKEVKEQ